MIANPMIWQYLRTSSSPSRCRYSIDTNKRSSKSWWPTMNNSSSSLFPTHSKSWPTSTGLTKPTTAKKRWTWYGWTSATTTNDTMTWYSWTWRCPSRTAMRPASRSSSTTPPSASTRTATSQSLTSTSRSRPSKSRFCWTKKPIRWSSRWDGSRTSNRSTIRTWSALARRAWSCGVRATPPPNRKAPRFWWSSADSTSTSSIEPCWSWSALGYSPTLPWWTREFNKIQLPSALTSASAHLFEPPTCRLWFKPI